MSYATGAMYRGTTLILYSVSYETSLTRNHVCTSCFSRKNSAQLLPGEVGYTDFPPALSNRRFSVRKYKSYPLPYHSISWHVSLKYMPIGKIEYIIYENSFPVKVFILVFCHFA